ncbi:MAG: translocation/assembly module TamB domain-containing protein, partial [Acidimicrobiales bacterium]
MDLRRWLDDAPASRLSFTVRGSAVVDSGVPPTGSLTAVLDPSLFAGIALDAGGAHVRLTESRLELDSMLVQRPGLIATGSGALGWHRTTPGAITLNLDADSLSELDSLVAWVAGLGGRAAFTEQAALVGSARLVVTLTGALDSLTVAAGGSGRGLRFREWLVPAWEGSVRVTPGPVPVFEGTVALDSLERDQLAFGDVAAAVSGTPDSLHWFGRSRLGDVAAFLAGGRYARRRTPDRADSTAVAVDSLALLLPGGIWLLERPTTLTLGDSVARLDTVALKALEGPGRLWLYGDLPTAGRADAAAQLESFPFAGLFALLQRDTLGVSGALTASIGLAGTRREPVMRGSFSLADASVGAFRIPFLDGTVGYRDRRLDGALQLWRLGARIADASWHLPLDLGLTPIDQRQIPDTLSVQARVDSVDLTLLETLTPLVRQVTGALSADVGIGGRWDAPVLRGGLRIVHAGAFIPALNVRYEDVNGQLSLGGDTIRVDSLTARGERGRGRAAVTGFVRLERLTRPVLALVIDADQFKALDQRGYLSVTASGRQSLTGPVIGATLTGRGTVTAGVLYFTDLVTKRVVKLDAPWVADLIDTSLIRRERLGPEFQSRFLDSLRIRELQLAMGSDFWLRSNEANIQLTGTVDVSKERDQYRLTGTLQASRGTYRLEVGPVTRQFAVTHGTVRYFGTPDLDAELDISARHVVRVQPTATGGVGDTITVVAHIGGTLLVPRLDLVAEERELSQTEI